MEKNSEQIESADSGALSTNTSELKREKERPEPEKEKERRGFAEAYRKYVQTLTSLRAFASELSPAIQDSARKANLLVEEATAALVKSWGFSSYEEFLEQKDSEETNE